MSCRMCQTYKAYRKCLECNVLLTCLYCRPTQVYQLCCSQACSYRNYERSLVIIYSSNGGAWSKSKGMTRACKTCPIQGTFQWKGVMYCLWCLRKHCVVDREIYGLMVNLNHNTREV
jgi:hypothetical protein